MGESIKTSEKRKQVSHQCLFLENSMRPSLPCGENSFHMHLMARRAGQFKLYMVGKEKPMELFRGGVHRV